MHGDHVGKEVQASAVLLYLSELTFVSALGSPTAMGIWLVIYLLLVPADLNANKRHYLPSARR
jgi:hypothetical protein